MASYTENYNLKKPGYEDFGDIKDLNDNADKIDAAIKDAKDGALAAKAASDEHIANKQNPHGVTKEQLGLGNVVDLAPSDQVPTVTEVAVFANLENGDTTSTLFGKIKLAISKLIAHLNSESNPHKTTAEQVGAAAKTHTHNAEDINAGVLPIGRGGTGCDSLAGIASALAGTSLGPYIIDPQNWKVIVSGYAESFSIDSSVFTEIKEQCANGRTVLLKHKGISALASDYEYLVFDCFESPCLYFKSVREKDNGDRIFKSAMIMSSGQGMLTERKLAISTDITTDGESNAMAVSPKAVKTYCDGHKPYITTTTVTVSESISGKSATNSYQGAAPTAEGYTAQRIGGYANGDILGCTPNGWIFNYTDTTKMLVTSITWLWLMLPS